MQQSGLGMEQYLKSMNKTEEELREEIRPAARKRVCQSLVLGKIAEEEKVEVSGAEIDAEIEEMTGSAAENRDELKRALNTPQARESIEQTLVTRKTVQRLVEIAQGSKKTDTIQKKEKKKK
jgi:trigger factor